MKPPELERDDAGPPPPLAYIWLWFAELSNSRGGTGFGALPLSYSDMAAFFALSGLSPEPWEVRVLRSLDLAALGEFNKSSKEGDG